MKFRWLLISLLGLPAVAQPHGPPAMATSFVQYMSGPAACQVAAVYFDQTQHKPYYCYPANTWVAFGGSSNGVTQLIAGTNITLDPSGGTGVVTINATGGGSGPVQTCDASTMSNYVPGVCIGTLDTAQILAFDGTSGTAVNVITAPGAGKLVTISQASAQYVFNSQPFSGSCQVDVEVNSNQFLAAAALAPDCTQTTDQYSVQSGWGLASSAPASSLSNQALGLYLDSVVNLGSIATSSISVGDSGVGYIAADTWFVNSEGSNDAIGTVLTATPYPITVASSVSNALTISGDESALFVNGSPVVVTGSTCNDGIYTAASSLFGAGVTVITLNSGPACDTADGNIAGGVLTYSLTPGTGYAVASNQPTVATGSQPTNGTGLQIDINSLTGQGDGSILYAIYFSVVPVT